MKDYLRFVKLEHTLFSLPVVFAGAALAARLGWDLDWKKAGWIFLAVLGARSAGFGMNRALDHEIDARNPRTRSREIPAGKISIGSAWAFIGGASALYLLAAGMLSPVCLALAPVPLALFFFYPFLKRFTALSHLGLGLAWGTAPLGGWLAVTGRLGPLAEMVPALLLAGFCVFWVAGFDVIYALLDRDFDRANGLHSLPAAIGESAALRVSQLLHFAGFLFLGTLVQTTFNGPAAFSLFAAAGLLILIGHARVQFGPLDPSAVDFAFFKVNAAVAFLVLILTAV